MHYTRLTSVCILLLLCVLLWGNEGKLSGCFKAYYCMLSKITKFHNFFYGSLSLFVALFFRFLWEFFHSSDMCMNDRLSLSRAKLSCIHFHKKKMANWAQACFKSAILVHIVPFFGSLGSPVNWRHSRKESYVISCHKCNIQIHLYTSFYCEREREKIQRQTLDTRCFLHFRRCELPNNWTKRAWSLTTLHPLLIQEVSCFQEILSWV